MDFYIERGQKYRIRISDKESDAVKIAASNLEKELITTDRQELLEILAKQKKQAV